MLDNSDLEEVASETCKVPALNTAKDSEDVDSEGVELVLCSALGC